MKLPNIEQAEVAEAKLVDYLLNPLHPIGRTKAAFFMAFGFSPASWKIMRNAFIEHALQYDVTEIAPMTDGIHYLIEGALQCPDNRIPVVRVVWRIDKGMVKPRFITAYPGE